MMRRILRRIDTVALEFEVLILHFVSSVIPFHHIRRFFYRLSGMKIGRGSTLHMGARFYDPEKITIGEDSIVGENVVLDGREKLTIGNHVDIATGVMIYNSEHDIGDPNFRAISAPVIIGDYVFIGPRAIILPGVTVGRGAVIGAGAIVTKDVGELMVVGGVPAKQIGVREIKDLNYKLGRAAWFR
jgi:acetyltransferase-like isoleucine patch superfamily enzyme